MNFAKQGHRPLSMIKMDGCAITVIKSNSTNWREEMTPEQFEEYAKKPIGKRLLKYVDDDPVYQPINNTYYRVSAVDILDAMKAIASTHEESK